MNVNDFLNSLLWFFAGIGVLSCICAIMFVFLYRAWSKIDAEHAAEREEEAAERAELHV